MRGAANRHFLLIANNTLFSAIPLSVIALLDRQFVSDSFRNSNAFTNLDSINMAKESTNWYITNN
jgi:hypothetical protein